MSPVIQNGDKFSFDEAEQTKLHLIWISSKNFSRLKENKNQALLKVAWSSLKNDLHVYFRNQQVTFETIIGAFKSIHLTIDPEISMQYDNEQNTLDYHLWFLFFSLCRDNGNCFVIPIPAWKLGGELVHEFDHYLFLKEHDMIGKGKNESDAFKEKKGTEMEKRAFSRQIVFLETCKNNVPPSTLTYKIKQWEKDRTLPINFEATTEKFAKDDVVNSIEQAIQGYTAIVKKIESGQNYDDSVDENNVQNYSEMVKILSLPIKLESKKKDYPKVEMDL